MKSVYVVLLGLVALSSLSVAEECTREWVQNNQDIENCAMGVIFKYKDDLQAVDQSGDLPQVSQL